MYNIVTYHTVDENLLKRWHALWNASKEGHFFNSPEWFLVTCDVYNISQFTIITIEEDDELVLVLPLVTKKVFGISVLSSPGGKFVNKSSLLVKTLNKELINMLSTYLLTKGNFYLQELSSEIADAFCSGNRHLIKKAASINPYLPISPDPFMYLSSKNKSQIRGILRKNEKEITFKSFTGDMDALETVFELDNRSSKKQQGKATFVTEQDKQFFRELLRKMPDNFVVDIVYHDNTAVVYGVGFIYKNIYHACNTAFDAHYRFLRPGKLLAHFRLKRLQEDKFDLIDFGRGNSMLKQELTKLSTIQYDVFYISSFVRKHWLLAGQQVYDGILNSKLLYTTYLSLKKRLLYR